MSTTKKPVQQEEKGATTRGASILMLEFNDLAIEEGFNCREDYGDIEELAASIKEHGVKVPLKGHKEKDGKYYITDGHRRYKALTLLNEKGVEMKIPLLSDSRDSEEQRVINLIICNMGKKLTMVEEANVVQRLIDYGYSEAEIATKLSFTKIYVKNLTQLNSAPKKIKNLITNGVVSPTQILELFRKEKDFTKVTEVVEGAIVAKQARTESKEGGSGKVTKKDLVAADGKQNSVQHLKKLMRVADKKEFTVNEENRVVYNFAKKLISGLYDLDSLVEELFTGIDAGDVLVTVPEEEEA